MADEDLTNSNARSWSFDYKIVEETLNLVP